LAKLSDEVKTVIEGQAVFPLSSSSRDGVPNVIPMTFVKVLDDNTLLAVDNLMNKTKANIQSNPVVALCVWDREKKKAYQIKGEVTFHTCGPLFESAVQWVKSKTPALEPKSALAIKVSHVYDCQPGETLGKEI